MIWPGARTPLLIRGSEGGSGAVLSAVLGAVLGGRLEDEEGEEGADSGRQLLSSELRGGWSKNE